MEEEAFKKRLKLNKQLDSWKNLTVKDLIEKSVVRNVDEPKIEKISLNLENKIFEIDDEPLAKRLKVDSEVTTLTNLEAVKNLIVDHVVQSMDEPIVNNKLLNLEPKIKSSVFDVQNKFKKQASSPKKVLHFIKEASEKTKFIYKYGNYSRYYGYRNEKDFNDVRLDIFAKHKYLFEGKDVLDIGCNSGLITMKIAEDFQNFNVKHIIGFDIDKSLINKATKLIEKKRRMSVGRVEDRSKFPFNIKFVHGNYILRNDILLEIEREQFDLILCLSVTKWIHLNFGDSGLKQAFKRMFLQIRSGGFLILEPQPWHGYKRRKKLTPEINENYRSIVLKPEDFPKFLLGPDVGFCKMTILETPQHDNKGFRRPLQLFYKK